MLPRFSGGIDDLHRLISQIDKVSANSWDIKPSDQPNGKTFIIIGDKMLEILFDTRAGFATIWTFFLTSLLYYPAHFSTSNEDEYELDTNGTIINVK